MVKLTTGFASSAIRWCTIVSEATVKNPQRTGGQKWPPVLRVWGAVADLHMRSAVSFCFVAAVRSWDWTSWSACARDIGFWTSVVPSGLVMVTALPRVV